MSVLRGEVVYLLKYNDSTITVFAWKWRAVEARDRLRKKYPDDLVRVEARVIQ